MIDTALGGMKTRFLFEGKSEALLCLASSKRSEKSFLETHMKKKLESEKDNVIIVDEPVWNVKPANTYSGIRFSVALGNKFLQSQIVPDDSDISVWMDKGYKILSVPIEFRSNFMDDIDRALCDYAGISSSEITKYISGQAVADIKNRNRKNPFTKDIIEVGNAPDDKVQYYDYFDLNRVPKELWEKPMFIHLDMSVSGDMTGIAGVVISGKKHSVDELSQANDLQFSLVFSVSVKAPKGRQVSFEKNKNFIYWLKENGFRIAGISSDTYQSYETGQILLAKGYNYSQISVDRVDPSSHVCKPYQYFKSTIYEKRLDIYESEKLTNEIIDLERNVNTGKVDHPDGGCFTGETKVSLVDGRKLSFLELIDEYNSGKTNYVYSVNLEKNKIEPKKILKAWKTKENQPLIRITLDTGDYVDCTLNHKFMLRNGSYVEAKDLIVGESLMQNSVCEDNHPYAVSCVSLLDYTADVYDIEVEDNHNFALACGVFVHNSKDVCDAVCGAVYNASQYAEQYAYDYGESLNTFLDFNEGMVEDEKSQLIIDFEKELSKAAGSILSTSELFMPVSNEKFEPMYYDSSVVVW